MALSNKFGWLVLTTGNKSEMSVGYCTLYGDMAGGFAVLKDVPKTLVYQMAEYRNKRDRKPIIPLNTFERAPTAELRPNQKEKIHFHPTPFSIQFSRLMWRKIRGSKKLPRWVSRRK